MSFGNATAYAL